MSIFKKIKKYKYPIALIILLIAAIVYFVSPKEDRLHNALNVIGMAPVVGESADLINGAIYASEGNNIDATISTVAALPFVGWLATTGKTVRLTVKCANGTKTTLKFVRNADGLLDFGTSHQLAKILGTEGTGLQAHHLISWNLRNEPLVQKAAETGFHINSATNGVALEKYTKLIGDGLHANHPAYDDFIQHTFEEYVITNKGYKNITGESAKNFLENTLIPELKKHIETAKSFDGNLNDYFKAYNKSYKIKQ